MMNEDIVKERYGQINEHWLVNEETVYTERFKVFTNHKKVNMTPNY